MSEIFLTSPDPRVCAENLCDQHLTLQITQASMVLSTIIRTAWSDSEEYGPTLKETNSIVEWGVQAENRQCWLLHYGLSLCSEFEDRFGEEELHSKKEFAYLLTCGMLIHQLTMCGKEEHEEVEILTPTSWWVEAEPEDVFESYKVLLRAELKSIKCEWTHSMPPYWLKKSGIKLKRVGEKIQKQ